MKLLIIVVIVIISLSGCSDPVKEIQDLFDSNEKGINSPNLLIAEVAAGNTTTVTQSQTETSTTIPPKQCEVGTCTPGDNNPEITSDEIISLGIDSKSVEWNNWKKYENPESLNCEKVPRWCQEYNNTKGENR